MKAFLRYSEMGNDHSTSPFKDLTVPLTLKEVRRQVQNMIKHDTSLIVETGDRYEKLCSILVISLFNSFFYSFYKMDFIS